MGEQNQNVVKAFHGVSETELLVLSSAIVAPGRQRRIKALLRKSSRCELRDDEGRELDSLLEDADRTALLKARAALKLSELAFHRMAAE